MPVLKTHGDSMALRILLMTRGAEDAKSSIPNAVAEPPHPRILGIFLDFNIQKISKPLGIVKARSFSFRGVNFQSLDPKKTHNIIGGGFEATRPRISCHLRTRQNFPNIRISRPGTY